MVRVSRSGTGGRCRGFRRGQAFPRGYRASRLRRTSLNHCAAVEAPTYSEWTPSAPLGALVECFWTTRARATPGAVQRVVPDGCMDILFSFGDAVAERPAPRSTVVGTMMRARSFVLRGQVDLFGVRFRPGVATALLRIPGHEVTDRAVSLADLWHDAAEIEERLFASDSAARVRLMEAVLLRRLAGTGDPDRRVLAAARRIEATAGQVSLTRLHETLGLGRRQMERLFLDAVGLSPKTACRVARFRAALRRLGAEPRLPLARLALETGYHDQAHFTREFRALAGITPGAYRREIADVASVQDASADAA